MGARETAFRAETVEGSRASWEFLRLDAAIGRRTDRGSVSPAYGCIKSALVKCSNEGGLGPRFNMKGDHGSSIFSMLMVDGVLSESFDLF